MDARSRGPRPRGPQPSGQHLLRSAELASELVGLVRVTGGDLVLEIGAGTGRLTEPLAQAGCRVIAVEVDIEFAGRLRRRFAAVTSVEVVERDVLEVPLPDRPFRAFGNLPFALTSAILRRLLDDPGSALVRADLIVQFEVARKRAAAWPSTLTSLRWLPWWELSLDRRLSRFAFDPPPAVDAALLSIARRAPPLLAAGDRRAYTRLLESSFRRGDQPVRRALAPRLKPRAWRRFAHNRGLDPDASARDLDVFDWVALSERLDIGPRIRS